MEWLLSGHADLVSATNHFNIRLCGCGTFISLMLFTLFSVACSCIRARHIRYADPHMPRVNENRSVFYGENKQGGNSPICVVLTGNHVTLALT